MRILSRKKAKPIFEKQNGVLLMKDNTNEKEELQQNNVHINTAELKSLSKKGDKVFEYASNEVEDIKDDGVV